MVALHDPAGARLVLDTSASDSTSKPFRLSSCECLLGLLDGVHLDPGCGLTSQRRRLVDVQGLGYSKVPESPRNVPRRQLVNRGFQPLRAAATRP